MPCIQPSVEIVDCPLKKWKDDIHSFEFYLSDFLTFQAKKEYMGLAIKNDNLVYIYNLGTKDVEIPLDSKPVSSWPAYFSIVKIER